MSQRIDSRKRNVYDTFVIRTFASAETEEFFRTGRARRLPPDIRARAVRRLLQVNAATELQVMTQHNGLPAVHPGEFLEEVLGGLEISQADFARALGVSKMRVSHIIHGTRPVTAEVALLFGKALGQTPEYWLNLQMDYDLKEAGARMKKQVRQVKLLHKAA